MLGRNDEGAVHLIEATLAAAMVMAALFYVNNMAPQPSEGRPDGLEAFSADLLNVLEYRGNSLEHPALDFTLSSDTQWKESSDELYEDILHMLPPGTYCYMETPYGTIGRRPATGASLYVRPFIACDDEGGMLDCKLTLWRV